jgi:hypothetical protein
MDIAAWIHIWDFYSILLPETARETKSPRPFSQEAEFIMLEDSWEIISQSRSLICVRGLVKYFQNLSPTTLQNVVTVTGHN